MKNNKRHSVLRFSAVLLMTMLLIGVLCLSAFAADPEVKYTTDGGTTWTNATLADAMTATAGQTATIEVLGDITLTQGFTVSSGDITIKSTDGQKFTLTKGSDARLFTVTGGELSIEGLILDGASRADGLLKASGAGAVLNVTDSVLQKAGAGGTYGAGVQVGSSATLNLLRTTIQDCYARQGAGVEVISATAYLTDSNILNCKTVNAAYAFAPAIYISAANVYMDGGLITGNTSYRTGNDTNYGEGAMIGGAVTLNGYSTNLYVSGDAIIRGNQGYKRVGGTNVLSYGGDVHYFYSSGAPRGKLYVDKDFTGSVGLSSFNSIASTASGGAVVGYVVDSGIAAGTIINGLVDNNSGRVAKSQGGNFVWADAVAEVDDGSVTYRFTTLADAVAYIQGTETKTGTITILCDSTLSAGAAISAGNITIKSPEGKKYTLKKASDFGYMLAVTGGTLSVENLILDGDSHGSLVSVSGSGAILNVTDSILQKAASSGNGGAAYVASSGVLNLTRTTIQDCIGLKGAGIYAASTVNMTDSNIIRCKTNSANTSQGSAIFVTGGTVNMTGGIITENISYGQQHPTAVGEGGMIDGAVALYGYSYLYVSGDAIIRGNQGYRVSGTSPVLTYGGDVVYTSIGKQWAILYVKSDFTGSVGLANPYSIPATASGATWIGKPVDIAAGTIIGGVIDTNSDRVAKSAGGTFVWADAAAETDIGGKITRYVSYADAYAAVRDTTPIKLLANATIDTSVLVEAGDIVKVIANGYTVSFVEAITCGEPTVASEPVGAFELGSYSYAGAADEVSTYTATAVTHVHTAPEATATAPSFCSVCGKLVAFPTDESLNVRYSTDGGAAWTYAAIADAMTAVSGQTAIVELYRDITLTAGITVSAGDITIRGFSDEIDGEDGTKTCTITQGANVRLFTVTGGELSIEGLILDGTSKVEGLLKASGAGAVLNVTDSLLQKAGASGTYGAGVQVGSSATLNLLRTTIQDCYARQGAGVEVISATAYLTDSNILNCTTMNVGYAFAPAIYISAANVYMDGGLITGNTSYRTGNDTDYGEGAMIDGAVTLNGYSTNLYVSGDAIIRGNRGYKRVDGANVLSYGGDVHYYYSSGAPRGKLYVDKDFTGSVGLSSFNSIASTASGGAVVGYVVDGGIAAGTIINGLVDNNSGRVAKSQGGNFVWADAKAELDMNGKITRYLTLEEAYAIAGSTNPIKLLADGSVTFNALGDSVKIIENGYTFRANFTGGFRKSGTEEVMLGAFEINGITVAGQPTMVSIYEALDGGSIASGGLIAGTDLAMRFYAHLGEEYTNSILRVTRGEKSIDLSSAYDEASGQYYFTYRDIAPQCAGDLLTVELICNDEVLDSRTDYSILQYCLQLLAASPEELGLAKEKATELKTLTRDLLEYCASAQLYKSYKIDALVNSSIKASAFAPLAKSPRSIVVNSTVEGVSFTEAGLRFADVNNLYFKFTTPNLANTKLVVNGVEHTSGEFANVSGTTYIFYTEDLYATQFDKLFTVQLYSGDTLVQTLTYSVGAYVHSMLEHSDPVVRNLAKATYNYGVAARLYNGGITDTVYTMQELDESYGAVKLLGGSKMSGTALLINNTAAGAEFGFRGKGDLVLNITAAAEARIEVQIDTSKVEHILVSAGTADYKVGNSLIDGKHTVRIVQENGAVTLNSVKLKGYLTETEDDRMFIEFVGAEVLGGYALYLNYDKVENDATGTYAVRAANELGARYLISGMNKTFTATEDIPDLVVIDYKEGTDYTALLANIRAAYGEGVKILFAAGAMDTPNIMTLADLGNYVVMTTDTSGYNGYPTLGGSSIMGAELAKYIRENYDFFTAEEAGEAAKDIIIKVDAVQDAFMTDAIVGNEFNSFYVYVRTSDPSGKYYIRYNFTYEFSDERMDYRDNSGGNLSNFRVRTATLGELTSVSDTEVGFTEIIEVLQVGEISTAIKPMYAESSKVLPDGKTYNLTYAGIEGRYMPTEHIGGLHGDERILDTLPQPKLVVDGVAIQIKNGEACIVTGNSVTFDQSTMMYEWGTSTLDSYGTPMTTHTQHFTITREAGFYNRQSYEWQQDMMVSAAFLQMYTIYHTKDNQEICPIVEMYNGDGVLHAEGKTNVYDIEDSYKAFVHSANNRRVNYSSEVSGISAMAFYDTCTTGNFAYNDVKCTDFCIHKRTQGDNKLYGSFNSRTGNENVAAGSQWMVDVGYSIDYVAP